MLVVSLCKPVICKLKILGGRETLIIINQWREPQKWGANFKISEGEAKLGEGGKEGGKEHDC